MSSSKKQKLTGQVRGAALETLFSDLFTEGRIGLAVFTADGGISEANEAWCQMFEYTREEMLGLRAEQLCHKDYVNFLPGQIASPYAKDQVLNIELGLQRKSGATFWGKLLSRSVFDQDGTVLHIPVLLEDISAKKQRESALTKAMQKLQIIADKIPAMMSYVSSDLRYQFVNEGYEALYKRSKSEIIGRKISDIVTEPVWREAKPFFERALTGEQVSYEGRFANNDANLRDALVSLVPDLGSSGEVRGLFILVTNITDLKKTEKRLQDAIASLRASEVNLKALMEASPDTLMVVDVDGTVLYCNSRVFEMLGYQVEELLGQNIDVLLPLNLRELHKKHMHHFHATPRVRPMRMTMDLVAIAKNGEQIPVDIGLSPTKFDGKDVVMATIHDITGIRAAFESSEQIADIVEASGDAIFRCSVDGRIQFWSKGAELLYGFPAEEMVGEMVDQIIPEDEVRLRKSEIQDALVGNDVFMQPDSVRKHKDGTLVEVSVAVFPIRDSEGRVVGGASVHRDIRELKRLEGQLRHAQRLDAAGLLAGGVAHDFNNILTVIQGYCALITESQSPDSLLVRQVHAIESAAQRASSLTRQLLAFSQKQRRDVRILNPRELLHELAPILQRAIGEDIRLETRLSSTWNILDDPADFEQIILNLAVNSRHAMPKGGVLRIGSRDVEITRDGPATTTDYGDVFTPIPVSPGSHVLLEVTDTGIGIKREVLTRIFEPFFTTKNRGEGSGLGLPVVYGIVKNIGGGIQVSSAEGRGTSFLIYLPRCLKPVETTGSIRISSGPQGKGTVLVVEDSPDILRLVQVVLQAAGYTVIPESSGAAALEREYSSPVDLVVTDVVMPGMNGPDFVQRWLQRHPGTSVLYMTGYAEESVLPFSINPDNLLLKPFKPALLLQKAAAAISKK
jgi:PAS domain S-box-containing protein